MCKTRRIVALLTVCAVALPTVAQEPGSRRLRIIPLEGHNAISYPATRVVTPPVVEVRDENDRPVEGATVTFKLPASGPGATFATGQATQTTFTDFRGQAGATGYLNNNIPGRFTIEITASHQGGAGRFLMAQTNSADRVPPEIGAANKSSRWKWILLSLAAGAGAGVGVYFGTRGSGTPISVGTGPIVVGAPR